LGDQCLLAGLLGLHLHILQTKVVGFECELEWNQLLLSRVVWHYRSATLQQVIAALLHQVRQWILKQHQLEEFLPL
jgi:hypothetical protein